MTTQALQQAKEALIKGYKDGIYTPKQFAEALDALAALATVSDASSITQAALPDDLMGDLVALYTKGYQAGHHGTVEGTFTDVHYSDQRTYLQDEVKTILDEGDLPTVSALVAPSSTASSSNSQPAAVVDEDDEGLFAEILHGEDGSSLKRGDNLYAAPSPSPVSVQPSTPSSRWVESGEPDPHDDRYDCERAALTLGKLTDDELANAAFMNYDIRPSFQDIVDGKAHMPIVYMTAVKDRIRWLSRSLEKALSTQAAQPISSEAQPVAFANWKVGTKSYVPFRTREEAEASVLRSEVSATQNGPYAVAELYASPAPDVRPSVPALPERVIDTLIPKGLIWVDETVLAKLHDFAHAVQGEVLARLPSTQHTDSRSE